MQYRIPLSYNPIDIPKLTAVLSRYEGQHHNKIITDFEEAFKKETGAKHAIALNSGTSAIHLALKVLGIGPGDVVLAPTFTYVATVNPVLYLGAQPVLIDSELETWNMNPALLESAIKNLVVEKRKPKAIIVVHTYGMPANMEAIGSVAKEYGIPIVEDAAESLGSTHHATRVGLLGDMGIYSFNNNKVVTTYGGGVLVTNDPQRAKRVRLLALQAREELPYYEHREIGYNYALGPLNAAYGLSQLSTLGEKITHRRGVFEGYLAGLSAHGVEFQREKEGSYSNRWFSTVLFKDQATRLTVSSVLQAEGIETRPLWRPMHVQPVLKDSKAFVTGTAEKLFEKGLCLPSGPDITKEVLSGIVEKVTKWI